MWFLLSENKQTLLQTTSQPLSVECVLRQHGLYPTQARSQQGWEGQQPPCPWPPLCKKPHSRLCGRDSRSRHRHCPTVVPQLGLGGHCSPLLSFRSQHPTVAQLPLKCKPGPVLALPQSCALQPTARLLAADTQGPHNPVPTRLSDLASSSPRPQLL